MVEGSLIERETDRQRQRKKKGDRMRGEERETREGK